VRVASILAVIALAGCAGTAKEPVVQAPVFYPPLPNPPRIQHLVTITGERDVAPPPSGFIKFIVGEEVSEQRLRQPYGVAMFDGKLYVADSRGPGLAVFDLPHQRFQFITGSGNGRMRRPINVTIDADGIKYVTDT
jgi:hypothetical protein